MTDNPLGRRVDIPEHYSPQVLFAIPRMASRRVLKHCTFSGYDLWNAFEFSHLDLSGKPLVYRLQIKYPCYSPNMVESKSLKLYLGSYSQEKMQSVDVFHQIQKDLVNLLQTGDVAVNAYDCSRPIQYDTFSEAVNIDGMGLSCSSYTPDAALIQVSPGDVTAHALVSHLLKTNCPITGQPDWGTVFISYSGTQKISEASLLRYIVSYRMHSGYHEQCCEQMFSDIYGACMPVQLTVACFYTRRGGIDINPVRYAGEPLLPEFSFHTWRQ